MPEEAVIQNDLLDQSSDDPAVVDVAVKVTTPALLDAPEASEMVSVDPRLEVKVTVFPATPFPFASFSVTVIVEDDDPLAVTEELETPTVEVDAL